MLIYSNLKSFMIPVFALFQKFDDNSEILTMFTNFSFISSFLDTLFSLHVTYDKNNWIKKSKNTNKSMNEKSTNNSGENMKLRFFSESETWCF